MEVNLILSFVKFSKSENKTKTYKIVTSATEPQTRMFGLTSRNPAQ